MSEGQHGYVVIFRARHKPDSADDYLDTVLSLKDRALADYGCTEFVYATTPEGEEIALTFWPDEDSIRAWRTETSHRAAQRRHASWYASFRIQVGAIHRDYGRNNS